jgi:hypothetical protein
MTLIDASWILNTYARMKTDAMFEKLSNTSVIKKVAEWCNVGIQTVRKLLSYEGIYVDHRNGPISQAKTVSDDLKPVIEKEIQKYLSKGFPCNTSYIYQGYSRRASYNCMSANNSKNSKKMENKVW